MNPHRVILTTSVALNEERTGDFAASALRECATHIVHLTDLLPGLLVAEISAAAAVPNPDAASEAAWRIRAAWDHHTP